MSEVALTGTQKQAVAQRAKECCEYCQSQARFSPDSFSVEHIVPRSRGGVDVSANLALSCQGCNSTVVFWLVTDGFWVGLEVHEAQLRLYGFPNSILLGRSSCGYKGGSGRPVGCPHGLVG